LPDAAVPCLPSIYSQSYKFHKLMIPKLNATLAINMSSYDYIVVEMVAQHIWYSEYSVGNCRNGERYTLQLLRKVQGTTKSDSVAVEVTDTIPELHLKVHLCAR
jgi:hypothetical protein